MFRTPPGGSDSSKTLHEAAASASMDNRRKHTVHPLPSKPPKFRQQPRLPAATARAAIPIPFA
jgi:hypothetical protein